MFTVEHGGVMADLREAYAATHTASMEWSEHERAIDRIAASGRCSVLGVALWKARYMACIHFKGAEVVAFEKVALREAMEALKSLYSNRYRSDGDDLVVRLVVQSLAEWIHQACRDCGGRRELMAGETRVVCDTCGGSGLRRYSDAERSRMMQISYGMVKHSAHKLQWLRDQIGTEDVKVNYQMAFELEKSS